MEKREEIYSVHFDTATRIFGISFDPESISMDSIAEIIEQLGENTGRPYKFIEMEL